MTKERVQQLTDIMARVLHYQDRGEPDWMAMDYAATKREYDALPEPIIKRYMNDAKFHAQVHRAVSMLLELDRSAAEPKATQYGRFPPGTKVRLLGSLMPGAPLEGWEIETIDEPRPLKYRIRHPNGSLVDVMPELVALDPSENRGGSQS